MLIIDFQGKTQLSDPHKIVFLNPFPHDNSLCVNKILLIIMLITLKVQRLTVQILLSIMLITLKVQRLTVQILLIIMLITLKVQRLTVQIHYHHQRLLNIFFFFYYLYLLRAFFIRHFQQHQSESEARGSVRLVTCPQLLIVCLSPRKA